MLWYEPRLGGVRPCLWCGHPWGSTRDHVVPVAAGGGDDGNIVPACPGCNTERGKIASYAAQARAARDGGLPWTAVAGLHRQAPAIAAVVAKWREIETARLGYSPSAALDLTLPSPPPGGYPLTARAERRQRDRAGSAALAAARAAAEARFAALHQEGACAQKEATAAGQGDAGGGPPDGHPVDHGGGDGAAGGDPGPV